MSSVNNNQPSPFQAVIAGSVAGAVTPFSYQPLWAIKTQMQESNGGVAQVISSWKGRSVQDITRTLYAGVGVNAVANGALFSLGCGLNKVFSEVINEEGNLSLYEKGAAAVAAGVSLSPVNTAVENIMIQKGIAAKQAKGAGQSTPRYMQVVQNMFAKEGVRAFTKGVVGTAIREGVFYVPAYAVFAPRFSQFFKEEGMDENTANLAGGMAAGAISAILSHPADSWKTFHQLNQTPPASFKPYLSGMGPRTTYAALATAVFVAVNAAVLDVMKSEKI
jgi:hypothetical protein